MKLKVKNQAIYGTFLGFVDSGKTKVRFLDDELGKIVIYKKSKLEKAY